MNSISNFNLDSIFDPWTNFDLTDSENSEPPKYTVKQLRNLYLERTNKFKASNQREICGAFKIHELHIINIDLPVQLVSSKKC